MFIGGPGRRRQTPRHIFSKALTQDWRAAVRPICTTSRMLNRSAIKFNSAACRILRSGSRFPSSARTRPRRCTGLEVAPSVTNSSDDHSIKVAIHPVDQNLTDDFIRRGPELAQSRHRAGRPRCPRLTRSRPSRATPSRRRDEERSERSIANTV